jgi:hypothetical protein
MLVIALVALLLISTASAAPLRWRPSGAGRCNIDRCASDCKYTLEANLSNNRVCGARRLNWSCSGGVCQCSAC